MKRFMKRIEEILETGGIKKDIALLAVSGVALLVSIFDLVLCHLTQLGFRLSCAVYRLSWKQLSGLLLLLTLRRMCLCQLH